MPLPSNELRSSGPATHSRVLASAFDRFRNSLARGMIEKLPNQSGHWCVCADLTPGPRQHGLAGQAPQSGTGLFCFLSIDSIVVFIAYNVAHNVFAKLRSVPASWLWTFGWVCNSQQRAINTYTGFNTSYPVSHCVDACFCWVCLDDYLEFRFTTL